MGFISKRNLTAYRVLSEENLVEIMCKTGIPSEELKTMLEEANNTDTSVVFYRLFFIWSHIRMSNEVPLKDVLNMIGVAT